VLYGVAITGWINVDRGTSVCNAISLNPEVGKNTSSNNPDANKTRNDDDTPSYA
jgi:hypothetical protein